MMRQIMKKANAESLMLKDLCHQVEQLLLGISIQQEQATRLQKATEYLLQPSNICKELEREGMHTIRRSKHNCIDEEKRTHHISPMQHDEPASHIETAELHSRCEARRALLESSSKLDLVNQDVGDLIVEVGKLIDETIATHSETIATICDAQTKNRTVTAQKNT